MSIKKCFWGKIDLIITILLITAAVLFWFIGQNKNEPLKSLLINLSAGFIGSVVTIWGIEFLRKKQLETKWSESKRVAKEDIIELKNMLISYISNPFGITVDQYKDDKKNIEEWSGEAIKNIAIEMNEKNFIGALNRLNTEQWQHFKINLPFVRFALSEKLQLYDDVLPPEIFGQLLRINRSFNSFYNLFGLLPELFTENEDKWPLNKGGVAANRLIREGLINTMSKDLETYFEEIKILINLLEEIKF